MVHALWKRTLGCTYFILKLQQVKMNRMRLKIAQRLKESQNMNAMLTTFNEVDMSSVMSLRKEHQV